MIKLTTFGFLLLSFNVCAEHFNIPSIVSTDKDRQAFFKAYAISREPDVKKLEKLRENTYEEFCILSRKFATEEEIRLITNMPSKFDDGQKKTYSKFKDTNPDVACKEIEKQYGKFDTNFEVCSYLRKRLGLSKHNADLKYIDQLLLSRYGKSYLDNMKALAEEFKKQAYVKYGIEINPNDKKVADFSTFVADKILTSKSQFPKSISSKSEILDSGRSGKKIEADSLSNKENKATGTGISK